VTVRAPLAGAGAECASDVTPSVDERCRRWQVENDPAHRADDVDAEFEQPLAQQRDLGACTRRTRGPQPKFLHQPVRGGGEEHTQLIGPEATAARGVDVESVVQFLDPIFDVAAGEKSASNTDGTHVQKNRWAGRTQPT
jgi:hypothetical protein